MSDFITTLRATTSTVSKQLKDSTSSKLKSVMDNFAANGLDSFIELAKNAATVSANMGRNTASVDFNYDISCSPVAQEALETLGFKVQLMNSSPSGHKEHWYFSLEW